MTTAVVDIFLTYQFIKRLTMPFERWPAYKQGIIDKDGNILKKRKDLTTQAEKSSWRLFDLLTLNLKNLLGKLPGGRSKIATYAAALFLLKESSNFTEESIETLEEDFLSFYEDNKQNIMEEAGVDEDGAPTVGVSGIAGLTPPGLKVSPKQRSKYINRNKKQANTVTGAVKLLRRTNNV
jgi:hypothetical protein